LRLSWRLAAQAAGVGKLRLEGTESAALLAAIRDLLERLESSRGSLAVLRCPLEVKRKADVWGNAGDALQLMRDIKAQFDPAGRLNPGRFIGGI
jgi:glycolate oxidase FAD binding subunit